MELRRIAERLRYLAAGVDPKELDHELHALARACESTMVYTVRCITPGDPWEPVHIFSSRVAADRFCEADSRRHITSDYVIDCPERMEQRSN